MINTQSPRESGKKSRIPEAIVVAVIGAIATIIVALITLDKGQDEKPISPSPMVVPNKSVSPPPSIAAPPQLDAPILQSAGPQSVFGFSKPPEVRVKVEQSSGLADKGIVAYLSRTGFRDVATVPASFLSFESQAEQRVLHAKLNTAAAISEFYQRGAIGKYTVHFEAWGRNNQKAGSPTKSFNFVYDEYFRHATFRPNNNNDFAFSNFGLLITKGSREGRYSSADSEELFRIRDEGLLLGQFQMWQNGREPIALEIGFIADGTENPRLTVTLPDGPLNTFSITPHPEARRQASSGTRKVKNGGAENFFAIVWKRGLNDEIGFRLHLAESLQVLQHMVDANSAAGDNAPVCEHSCSVAELAVDLFKLRVQGRGNGRILLKRLLVSELPYRTEV